MKNNNTLPNINVGAIRASTSLSQLKLILYFIFHISYLTTNAQVVLEQNPPSLQWRELKTPHFRLIFPESYQSESQKTANILERVYETSAKTLGVRPRPIPIILQNQTTISNGFVTPINRRSEFFTMPPQSTINGTMSWTEGLAIHEFRHIAQFDKAYQGRFRKLYYLIGDFGIATPTVFVPNWFFEGDAVGTETALTQSGRGRIPEFDALLRSQLLTQKPFKYSKAINGSYRDNVSNHYTLGYFMTSHLKNNYGADIWDKVLEKTYNNLLFARNIRKLTGLKINKHYENVMADAQKRWQERANTAKIANMVFAPEKRFFTSYLYPQALPDGSFIAIQSGLANIPQLVKIQPKTDKSLEKVEILHQLGAWNDSDKLSVANGKIIWTEFEYDPRWAMRNYSVLKTYDLVTKKVSQLSHKTRYFAPALSPDASKIAVVQVDESNRCSLLVLDAKNGEVLQKLGESTNDFYQHPSWLADGEGLVYIRQNQQGKCIESEQIATQQRKTVLDYTTENISTPISVGNYIVFVAPDKGVENLFAIHLENGQHYRISNSSVGAYYPSTDLENNFVFYNEYTPNGRKIAQIPANPTQWEAVEKGNRIDEKVQFFGKFMQAENKNIFANLPQQQYAVKPYNKLKNALHIYGWGPAVTNGITLDNPTLGIASQDLLSTTSIDAGVGYNFSEKAPFCFTNVSYQAWYPIIDFNFEQGKRSSNAPIDRKAPFEPDSLRTDQWSFSKFETGLRIPLNLTRSRFTEKMNLGVYFGHNRVNGYELPRRKISELFNGDFQTMRYSLNYSRLLKQNSLDVASRLGFLFNVQYRNTPFGGKIPAEQFGTFGSVSLPSFAKFHSIRLRAGHQRESAAYQFSASVPFPRGHQYTSFSKLNVVTADYRFPIFYPDWSLGRVGSIKRFKGNLWADAAQGTISNKNYTFRSVGFDLTMNFGITGLIPDMEMGMRSIYNPDSKKFIFQPLVVDIGF